MNNCVFQCHIGQQFKQEVHIKNLPPMFRPQKAKATPVCDEPGDIGLCALFVPKDQSSLA